MVRLGQSLSAAAGIPKAIAAADKAAVIKLRRLNINIFLSSLKQPSLAVITVGAPWTLYALAPCVAPRCVKPFHWWPAVDARRTPHAAAFYRGLIVLG